ALKQGGALTCWPVMVAGHIALQAFLVGLEFLPADVARMDLFHQGMPGLSCALLIGSPTPWTLDQTRAAIGKGASITRIMQDTQGKPTRKFRPPHFAAGGALDRTGRKLEAVVVEIPPHGDRGADLPEGCEQQLDRFLHVLIRIERHRAGWRIDESDRQLCGEFPPGSLMASAPLE